MSCVFPLSSSPGILASGLAAHVVRLVERLHPGIAEMEAEIVRHDRDLDFQDQRLVLRQRGRAITEK